MDDTTRTELEAAAFRRLVAHLQQRTDVQNIDLMNLAGFCRNCLSRWYREEAGARGLEIADPKAREIVYGMPYEDWKKKHQKEANADQKAKYVAYPGLRVPGNLDAMAERLVEDLSHIGTLTGEYKLSSDAVAWGEAWYHRHYTVRSATLDDDRFGGYIARKQTHIHKLAMVLAASSSDNRWVIRSFTRNCPLRIASSTASKFRCSVQRTSPMG